VTAMSSAAPSMLRARRSIRSVDRVGFPAFMVVDPPWVQGDETPEAGPVLRSGSQGSAAGPATSPVGAAHRIFTAAVAAVSNV
jgi:hypothetical protein